MKKLFVAIAFVFLASPLFAQNVAAVTATNISDVAGNKLASGQLCFLATDQNDNPISFQVGGGGQVIRRAFCSTVTAGVAAAFNVPNPATTSPSGIFYRVTVRDSSTGQEVLRYTGVTFTGGTFGFDTYVPLLSGAVFSPLSGTNVAGNLAVSGNLNVTGTFTPASVSTTSLFVGASTSVNSNGLGLNSPTATAAANASSASLIFNGSWWNGSSAVSENWACNEGPASTTPNPLRSFFICNHSAGIPSARFSITDLNPANAVANFASPDFDLVGHYWTGTSSSTDEVLLSTSYGTGANPPVTVAVSHIGSSGVFSVDLSAAKTVRIKRALGGGNTLLASDFALSAGWGSAATISTLAGTDAAFRFTVTPNGTGIVANPTVTVTFHDGTWNTVPICQVTPYNASGPSPTWLVSGSSSATQLLIGTNAIGSYTPVAAVWVGLMVSCQQSPN